jgi:hypothetical protein
LKLGGCASGSLPVTFLMGRVFLTIFNGIRGVNKKFSLGRGAQYLKSSVSGTAACTKFAWASNCIKFSLV